MSAATSLKLTDVAVAKDYIETVVEYGKEMVADDIRELHRYHAMLLNNSNIGGG